MKNAKYLFAALLLSSIVCAGSAVAGTVATGTIEDWPESGYVFMFDNYVSVVSNIQGWWSFNQIDPDRGWFYGYNDSTDVAHVTGISDISEITDASMYTYVDWYVGPVDEGDFVLFHNNVTGFYAAFRVDDIYGTGTWNSWLDATWYLQEDGSANFGPSSQCTDNDGDGYGSPADPSCPSPEEDCDDSNPDVHPGAQEVCNGADDECDGVVDNVDLDGDTYIDKNCGGDDCDDSNPDVNPGMTEIPRNGLNDDCNPNTPAWGTPASVIAAEHEGASDIANYLLLVCPPVGAILVWRGVRRRS